MAAGKNLGRTKLTEISPKKTVEGALGGLASSVAVALGVWWSLRRMHRRVFHG